jgi:signal peptidase II
MKRSSAYLLAAILTISCFGCDRITKNFAASSLEGNPPVLFAGGLLTLVYVENSGAMLSFGATLPDPARFWILTVGSGLLLAGMCAVLVFTRELSPSLVIALSLMLGGGVSNLVDRMLNDGRVVDFVTIGLGGLRTGVFNVADIAISAGVLLFFIAAFRRSAALHD